MIVDNGARGKLSAREKDCYIFDLGGSLTRGNKYLNFRSVFYNGNLH